MATGFATKAVERRDGPEGQGPSKLYRLSVRQYVDMIGAGILREDQPVELLGGLLVEKMTRYVPHDIEVSVISTRHGRVLDSSAFDQ